MHEYNNEVISKLLHQSVSAFNMSFQEYEDYYPLHFEDYEKHFDIPEIWFVTLELEKIENFLHYLKYFEKDESTPEAIAKDERILNFEEQFEPWMREIRQGMRNNELRIESSNRRKSAFLKTKLSDLEKLYIPEETEKPLDTIPNNILADQIAFTPIRLQGDAKINEISTFFYMLYKDKKTTSTKANLIRLILHVFRDKNGDKLKESTIITHFNDSKGFSRSQVIK